MVHTICTPIVKYLHLFPTFLELEYGVVPSTSEMEVLADCNVPINFCYPQYFSTDQTDEIKRIKHVEEFFSSYLKGKRNNASHYIDLVNFKPAELNTSIFKDLESEIIVSLNDMNVSDYNTEDVLSELVDAVPNKECDVATIFRQLNELKTQTVLELHRDCELSNEIINDIDMLCSGNEVSNLDNRLLWTRNENVNSASAIVNSDRISNGEGGEEFLDVHPLSKMSFDERRSAHSSDCELEDEDGNSKVLDECFGHGSIVEEEHYLLEQTTHGSIAEEEHYLLEQTTSNSSNSGSTGRFTNPFLENFDEAKGSVGDVSVVSTLNPNNPFLKFLTGDDVPEFSPSDNVSDKSSTSTVYESYVQELSVKQTSSTQDNKSTDVSFSEVVSCYTSSSDSVKMSKIVGSCAMSTQTSEDGSGGSQIFQQQSLPPPPLSIPPVQPYSNWSTGYGPYVGAFGARYTGVNNSYLQADYNMLQQMFRYNYGAAAFPNAAMGTMNRPMQGLSTNMQNRPMGMQNGPLSMQHGPMSMHNGPMGIQNGPTGMQNGPMGMQNGPMGMQNGPVGMQNGPMGMQNGPMGMHNGSMMMQGGPMPNGPMGFPVAKGPSQVSRICPPPGFAPNSNVYQHESTNFSNSQPQPGIPPQRAIVPQQQLCAPLQYSSGPVASTPNSSSMRFGSEKDFYEAYNEKLLLKTQFKKD